MASMQPNFKDGYSFSKELFAVEIGKAKIKMNKPVCFGQAILDLRKMLIMAACSHNGAYTLMYKFHYDYMQLNMELR